MNKTKIVNDIYELILESLDVAIMNNNKYYVKENNELLNEFLDVDKTVLESGEIEDWADAIRTQLNFMAIDGLKFDTENIKNIENIIEDNFLETIFNRQIDINR